MMVPNVTPLVVNNPSLLTIFYNMDNGFYNYALYSPYVKSNATSKSNVEPKWNFRLFQS